MGCCSPHAACGCPELDSEVLFDQETPVDLGALVRHEQETQLLRQNAIAIVLKVDLTQDSTHTRKPRILHMVSQGKHVVPAIILELEVAHAGRNVWLWMTTGLAPRRDTQAIPAKKHM